MDRLRFIDKPDWSPPRDYLVNFRSAAERGRGGADHEGWSSKRIGLGTEPSHPVGGRAFYAVVISCPRNLDTKVSDGNGGCLTRWFLNGIRFGDSSENVNCLIGRRCVAIFGGGGSPMSETLLIWFAICALSLLFWWAVLMLIWQYWVAWL